MKAARLTRFLVIAFFVVLIPIASAPTVQASGFTFEPRDLGVGFSIGYTFPFGWFNDVELNPGVSLGIHADYDLSPLVPNLEARASVTYQHFNGDRQNGYEYSFTNNSFYIEGLYHFDMGLPFSPYGIAGIGMDVTHIKWNYNENNVRYSGSDNGVGQGIIVGGGISFKTHDLLRFFIETTFNTSSWTTGPDVGDFLLRFRFGMSFYFARL